MSATKRAALGENAIRQSIAASMDSLWAGKVLDGDAFLGTIDGELAQIERCEHECRANAFPPKCARARLYRSFKKKLGELADFSGRALVAAGIGGGVVAKLALEKAPTTGLWELAMAIFGFGLIYGGIASQAAAEADKESEDATRPQ